MTGDAPPGAFERGLELHRQGRLEQAAACYREALAHRRDDHRALHWLGVLALQTGKISAAESLLRNAIGVAADQPDYHVSLGRLLADTGRPRKALDCYERALAIAPAHYAALSRRAMLLHRMGELDRAHESYRAAHELREDDPMLLVNLGALLNLMGRSEESLPLYERALELAPSLATAHGNLGNALAALGRYDDAVASFQHCLELEPAQPKVHANLGSCLLARGDPEPARNAFKTCLRNAPGDITALAMLAAIDNETGRSDTAAALMDFERLLDIAMVDPPAQQDMAGYLATLREHVLSHPTLAADPDSHTTKDGRQTGSLWPSTDPAVQHLAGRIDERIRAYIARRPPQWRPVSGLPPLWPAPAQWRIDMWATVLGEGGHQTPHIHPSGWLSGVFYVDTPMPADDDSQTGWIEFGCPPRDVRLNAEPLAHRVRPRAGELLLFPSYFFHRTVPLAGPELRLSIAFDVIPMRRK